MRGLSAPPVASYLRKNFLRLTAHRSQITAHSSQITPHTSNMFYLSWILTLPMLAFVPSSWVSSRSSSASLSSISPACQSRTAKQWAAVRTCWREINTPPQIAVPRLLTRDTIQGKEPFSAFFPPNMFNSKEDNPQTSEAKEIFDWEDVENLGFSLFIVGRLAGLLTEVGVNPLQQMRPLMPQAREYPKDLRHVP